MNSKPYYRYMLDGIITNSFTDKQLVPVEDAVDSTFKSILNKKTIKKQIYYLIQYADRDRLWIDKDDLIKDNLKHFIDDYEFNQLPESYIGIKVRKKFNEGKFCNGTVVKYDKKKNGFKSNMKTEMLKT